MSHVVQLEAFEAPLRNRRIRWFLTPGAPITYPPGFQEQCFIESPPFQRRILLTTHASSEAWKLVDRWDAMFVPATAQDWSLVLTVALNQPPPCLIITTPEVKVPPLFSNGVKQLVPRHLRSSVSRRSNFLYSKPL